MAASSQDTCCNRCSVTILRLLNVALSFVGVAFVAYGAVLQAQNGTFNIAALAGVSIALGGLIFLLSSLLVCCGYKYRCFLSLYQVVLAFLLVVQIILGCYLFIPSAREKLINLVNPPANIRDSIATYAEIIGGGVAFVIVAQLASFFLVCYQRMYLDDKAYRDDDLESGNRQSLLQPPQSTTNTAESAGAKRYREKNAAMYEKYNVGRTADQPQLM